MFLNILDRAFENLVQTDGYFLGCIQNFGGPGHLQEMGPLTIHMGLLCEAQSDAWTHIHTAQRPVIVLHYPILVTTFPMRKERK